MLTSFIDGRLRLRHPALKNPDTLALAESAARSLEGVQNVTGNPHTGSLLMTYDPAVLSRETLMETAERLRAFLPEDPAKPEKKARGWTFRRKCRAEAGVLSGTMSATVMGLFFGKRLHIAAGSLLLLACAQHLFRRRNRL